MDGHFGLTMIAGASAGLMRVGIAVAFLVAGATVVRRTHANAGWLVMVSAGIDLLAICMGFAGPLISSRADDGVDGIVQRTAAFTLLGALLSLASNGALLAALVQLASRPAGTGVRGD